jgi:hypothetical protein
MTDLAPPNSPVPAWARITLALHQWLWRSQTPSRERYLGVALLPVCGIVFIAMGITSVGVLCFVLFVVAMVTRYIVVSLEESIRSFEER